MRNKYKNLTDYVICLDVINQPTVIDYHFTKGKKYKIIEISDYNLILKNDNNLSIKFNIYSPLGNCFCSL